MDKNDHSDSQNNNEAIHNKIDLLIQKYQRGLPEKTTELNRLWTRCEAKNWDKRSIDDLRLQVHRLAGSAGSYGFSHMGEQAKALDQLLLNLFNSPKNTQPGNEAVEYFSALCQAMREASHESSPALLKTTSGQDLDPIPVVIVDDDREMLLRLSSELETQGIGSRVFVDPEKGLDEVNKRRPAVVILDVGFPEGDDYGFKIAEKIRELRADCPPEIIFVSAREDFESRVLAVNAGARAYFTKPVDMPALTIVMRDILLSIKEQEFRVLLVDDDDDQATFFRALTEKAGIQFAHSSGAADLLEKLIDFEPELILMDFNIPAYNGVDITRVIRQHESMLEVPIIFLSSMQDTGSMRKALKAGADAYLSKDIPGEDLINIVAARIQRYRRTQHSISLDRLTGIFTRTALNERIIAEIVRAQRENQPMCLAMLDIDDFKLVNDRHGHLVGDAVIKHVADLFKTNLRRSDLIGRYGGDELIVCLPNTRLSDAKGVLEKTRKAVHSGPVTAGDAVATVSISIGVSEAYPQTHMDAEIFMNELLDCADQNLYQAKALGKNQVFAD